MSLRVVKTKNRWTTAQLELLVDVWEKYYPHLKAGRGNEEIYEMMAEELKSAGCLEATLKQVRGRIHNLSGKYRKEASEVQKTGKPSQWSLYSKISNFFEYTVPVRFKSLGPPVYDMSDYIHMDLVMAETIERRTFSRKRTGQYEHPREYEMDENSLDIDDDELEPDEDSVDVDPPEGEEYSDAVQYDDENTVDEFPASEDPEAGPSGEKQVPIQEQSDQEKSEPKEFDTNGTDADTDSFLEDDDCSVAEPSENNSKNQLIHVESSFRHAAIEEFLTLLYSNQLYADVMLISCHEGVTCVMPAHRLVLANFSKFFSSVLGALKPNTNGNPLIVCLQPDISESVMKLLLQFMYTGKASVPEELMGDFVRCGQILKIRGVWSEEKGESVSERDRQPSSDASVRQATNDDASASSTFDEERSSASSPVTVIAPSPMNSSNETEERSERPRKRRKKLTKKAKKRMAQESDQESVDLEVSSEIGFDLLRSDNENEDDKLDGTDKQETESNGTVMDVVDNQKDDGFDENDHDDEDGDDGDDGSEGHDFEKESTADDDAVDEDENYVTEYIETDTYTETEEDYEMRSVVKGDSVSNLSTTATTTPEPASETKHEPKVISEHINQNDRIEQNGNVNGCTSPHDLVEMKHENSPSHDDARSEQETPVTVKTILNGQPATKSPDIRLALQTVPSTMMRIKQSIQMQSNSQIPHSSKLERSTNLQTYAIQSTSRGQILSKVRSLYSCKICGTRYNTSDGWVEHVVYTHSQDDQLMHNNAEGHITMLQCDLCSKYLASEYDWVHHILKKHTERYPHFHEELSMSDE